TACRRCGRPLRGSDPAPLRHQVAELPVVRPDVVEYQLHRLVCPCCHTSTCGVLPAGVRGHFGPRLEATLALLAGRHRLGRRPPCSASPTGGRRRSPRSCWARATRAWPPVTA